MYEKLSEGKATARASSLVSVVLCAIALCLSVPFGLVSLQRQAKRFGVSPILLLYNGLIDDDDDDYDYDADGDDINGNETKKVNDEVDSYAFLSSRNNSSIMASRESSAF